MKLYGYIICLSGFLTLKSYSSHLSPDEKLEKTLPSNSGPFILELSEEQKIELYKRSKLNINQGLTVPSAQSSLDFASWMRGYEEGKRQENYAIMPHVVYAYQKDVLDNIYMNYIKWVEKFITYILYMPILNIEDFNHLVDYNYILKKQQNFSDQIESRGLLQKPTPIDFKKYVQEEAKKNKIKENYFKGIEENMDTLARKTFNLLLNCGKRINNPADYRYVMIEVLHNLVDIQDFILKCDDEYQKFLKEKNFSPWEKQRLEKSKPIQKKPQTVLDPHVVLSDINKKHDVDLVILRNQIKQKEEEKKNIEKAHQNKITQIANQKEDNLKKLNQEKQKIKLELENLQADIKTLEDQIFQDKKTRDQLKNKTQNINNNKVLRDQLRQLEKEKLDLQQQLNDSKIDQESSKKKIIELEDFKEKAEIAVHENSQKQFYVKDDFQSELEQLRAEKAKLQEQAISDQQTISKLQKSQKYFIKTNNDLVKTKHELEEDLNLSKQQSKIFQEKIFSFEQDRIETIIELKELQSCSDQTKKENDRLLGVLLKITDEKQKLEKKVQNSQGELNSLLPVKNTPQYLKLNKITEFLFTSNSNLRSRSERTLEFNQKLLQENTELCISLKN